MIAALADIVAIFGPQQRLVLAREITKLHEEFVRGEAAEVLAQLSARPSLRGEMVLLLELSSQTASTAAQPTLAEEVATLISTEGLPKWTPLSASQIPWHRQKRSLPRVAADQALDTASRIRPDAHPGQRTPS